MPLNAREMTHHAALYAERRRCVTALAGCVCAVFGLVALGMLWPAAWAGLAIVLGSIAGLAAAVMWRLERVDRRIGQLEKFL